MRYGLIGEHLTHSYSCEIHGIIADYEYELHEVAREELDRFMREKSFKAINVTIPYKQDVIPYLDWVSERAKSIGAVNTVVNRDGKLYGYNTDFDGMEALLRHMGVELKERKVLILGTGGTSKTAHAVAQDLGAAEILHVSRSGGEGTVSYAEAAEKHADAHFIINTTPVGMFPKTEGRPIDIAPFTKLEGILDAVYNPLRTNLVMDGMERGLPASGGLYMLSAQAVYASAIFRGIEAETALIDKAFGAVKKEKENIVLIGMPSAGKTTIGKLLQERSGRELVDTDEMIIERIGCPIAQYMAEHGEKAFRAVEKEAVTEAAKRSGCIIATGGGAILDGDNVRALKQNGVIVFLDRALENLVSTDDRPLSSNREALEKRFHERYALYQDAADIIVDANVPIEEEIENIWEKTLV